MIRMSAVVLVLGLVGPAAQAAEAQGIPLPRALNDEATLPANDDFDEATEVPSLPFDDTVDTRAATGAPDDPICGGGCATVWYRYTPREDRLIGATTWGSDYDATIAVFTGTRGALEDFTVAYGASYRFAVRAGTTYHFLIFASILDLVGGRLRFALTDQPPFSVAVTAESVALMDKPSGVITARGEVTCSLPSHVIVGVGLERLLAQRYLTAGALVELDCVDHSPFEIQIQTFSASRFGEHYPPGQYVAHATAYGWDTSRGEAADATTGYFQMLVRGAP